MWQGMMELFDRYDQLSAEEQTVVNAQAGVIGLTTGLNCIKGTFSLRTR